MTSETDTECLRSEVKRTAREMDRILATVPNCNYSKCDAKGKAAFDTLESARATHHKAVRAYRMAQGLYPFNKL